MAKSLILAGGGTGGHILAGVAIAQEWQARGNSVFFVGAQGRLEEKLVPQYGFPIYFLKVGPLNRVSLFQKLKTFALLPIAFLKCLYLLFKIRPAAVLGVGGYVSGPFVLSAALVGWLWGCQTAVLEQNSIPGITNRLLGKFVRKIFVAFEWSKLFFPARKVIVSGNPIRARFKPLPSSLAQKKFTLFIFGGSQGAVGLNTLVIESLPHYSPGVKTQISFIHQTGEKDYERVLKAHQHHGTQARVEKFIDDMEGAYRQATLVISRAGSSSLSEIAAVQRAALLVPLPTASDNHQSRNAELFVEAGGALLVPQDNTSGQQFAELVHELIKNPDKIGEMEAKVERFFHPKAASEIVESLLQP